MFSRWNATAMQSRPSAEIASGRIVPYAAVATSDARTIETVWPGAAPARANTVEPSSPTSLRASVGSPVPAEPSDAGVAGSTGDVIASLPERTPSLMSSLSPPGCGYHVEFHIAHVTSMVNLYSVPSSARHHLGGSCHLRPV